ncbi:MAG TPA: tRNA (adenosine(37)-N6)-dimethylallyltransferase MiaA [Brumimicrobium sp.]|nr:tRNA (adenosine(37)-N6)-dimethylallyltransferase MiaA [Brumimicrobium sp.]
MKKLIVIAGPTASGKTSLSVELANRLNAPIISADSRQFYKELEIGTAKPKPEEIKNVPHYFVDSHSVTEPLSSGQFEKEALELTSELFKTNNFIILVGGSGMFINSLVYGSDQLPHRPEIREHWNQVLKEKGIEFLQNRLKEIDPNYYHQVDLQNPVRLIRALEIFEITKQPYSSLRQQEELQPRYSTAYFVIDYPREILYDRINRRVDIMVQEGLFEEAKNNLQHRNLQPLNTVGYKEIFRYLDGEISKEKAIELIKQNTRRYAKRQLTWFRKVKDAQWIKADKNDKMIENIILHI